MTNYTTETYQIKRERLLFTDFLNNKQKRIVIFLILVHN